MLDDRKGAAGVPTGDLVDDAQSTQRDRAAFFGGDHHALLWLHRAPPSWRIPTDHALMTSEEARRICSEGPLTGARGRGLL